MHIHGGRRKVKKKIVNVLIEVSFTGFAPSGIRKNINSLTAPYIDAWIFAGRESSPVVSTMKTRKLCKR